MPPPAPPASRPRTNPIFVSGVVTAATDVGGVEDAKGVDEVFVLLHAPATTMNAPITRRRTFAAGAPVGSVGPAPAHRVRRGRLDRPTRSTPAGTRVDN